MDRHCALDSLSDRTRWDRQVQASSCFIAESRDVVAEDEWK